MSDPIPCDIEHVTDFDEATCVYIRREDDQGVIEIRGLENIVLLRFSAEEWWGVLNKVHMVDEMLCERANAPTE